MIDGLDEDSSSGSLSLDSFEDEDEEHSLDDSDFADGSDEMVDDALDGALDAVELNRDTIEENWTVDDPEASVEVWSSRFWHRVRMELAVLLGFYLSR
jgi:hypothetical protein